VLGLSYNCFLLSNTAMDFRLLLNFCELQPEVGDGVISFRNRLQDHRAMKHGNGDRKSTGLNKTTARLVPCFTSL